MTAHVGHRRILKSQVEPNTDNPKWNCEIKCDVCDDVDYVVIHVKSNPRWGWQRVVKAKSLGHVWIRAEEVLRKGLEGFKGQVSLGGRFLKDGEGRDKRKKVKLRGDIHVEWCFMGIGDVRDMGKGWEVPRAYFDHCKGNRVKFYQDADCAENFKVDIDGWERNRCWKDIYERSLEAEKIIYVAGWSIFTEIKLVREDEDCLTVGELLKKKADEGVVVKVFIWDEIVSTAFNKGGLMATHDEDTKVYFMNTKVDVLKISREDDGTGGCCGTLAVSGLFTFHQKLWICDAPVPNMPDKKELCGFVGGLDITDGRWDNQHHSLFQTLDTYHRDDFHQACINSTVDKGPREPWHDCHSQVHGPGAWQLLKSFLERWRKHGKLYDPSSDIGSVFLGPDGEAENNLKMKENECWNSQVFRSIDARSCTFEDPESKGLHKKKGRLVEASIQRAYIHLIRKAKRFVYIENQYFMGSSRSWDHAKSLAPNLIPIELAMKIEQKIAASEDFHAYILVPMYPEGQIGDRATEELLHWQKRTCEMITKRVAKALTRHKVQDREPNDYISFYCLGNREKTNPKDGPDVKPPSGRGKRPFRNRRFMIYVHSKMMIVDDELIILGSANINERSMAGYRDVEICASYWQPKVVGAPDAHKGEVGLFRKSLWQEHLGKLPKAVNKPESLACVRAVRQAAQKNWEIFTADEHVDMTAHLLRYPYKIEKDGEIEAVMRHFPDIPLSLVVGYDTILPNILTA